MIDEVVTDSKFSQHGNGDAGNCRGMENAERACQWLLWGGMGNDGLGLRVAAGWQRGEGERARGSDRKESFRMLISSVLG